MPVRRPFVVSIRLAGVTLVVGLLAFAYRHVYIDDALIYARYIANALRGWGLVYNRGEHVNALTSPLYSFLVLAAAKLLHGRVLLASTLVSILALYVVCCMAEVLVPLAGLLLAATGYFYTLLGMETSLFLAFLLLPVLLVQRERYNWLPTVMLLLVLSRFEGAAMIVPLLFVLRSRGRWPAVASYVPVLVLTVVYLGLNRYWYGALLPASASAKLGQGRSGFWGSWPHAFFNTAYQLKPDFHPTLYIVIVVAVFAIPGLVRLRRSVLLQISLPFLAMLLAFYVLLNLPGYRWYYAPFIAFAMMYACFGLALLGPWRWLILPMLVLSIGVALRRAPLMSPPPPGTPLAGYPGIGQWLAQNAPAGARVEAAEIGTLGWFCQRCIIVDILGLTSPKNANHVAHGDLTSWFTEDRPDFIVIHHPAWSFEQAAASSDRYHSVAGPFGANFVLLERNDFPATFGRAPGIR